MPLPYSDRVMQLVDDWHEQAIQFAVPSLWGYEVVSGLRKAVSTEVLTTEEADVPTRELWELDIQEVHATV